ncbi:hypothetical protein CDIK_3128 [Cucumispora dikerogammari]|nr:hypothetical protein CDIK_3128 [Cucumispora dikerogammari]
MINQLFSTLYTLHCKENEYPDIIIYPYISYSESNLDVCTGQNISITEKLQCVSTVIDLKHFFDKEMSEVHNNRILVTIQLLSVDTHLNINGQSAFMPGEAFSRHCMESSKNTIPIISQIEGTTNYVLSLKPLDESLENSIIKYLRTHPEKAFKLIIFSYTQKNSGIIQNIDLTIRECKDRIQPLINIIDIKLKKISGYLDKFCDTKSHNKTEKNSYRTFIRQKVISATFEIKKLEYIPDVIETSIKKCLEIFQNVFEILIQEAVSAPKVEKALLNKNDTLKLLFIKIQVYFKEQLEKKIKQNETYEIDITEAYKNKIWLSLEKNIDSKIPTKFMFFAELIDRLYNNLPDAAYPVRLETYIFKLDGEKDILKK